MIGWRLMILLISILQSATSDTNRIRHNNTAKSLARYWSGFLARIPLQPSGNSSDYLEEELPLPLPKPLPSSSQFATDEELSPKYIDHFLHTLFTLSNRANTNNEEVFYSDPEPEDNTVRNVLLLSGYTLIILVSLIGNSTVCFVIYSLPKLRTTTNMLIVSLTVSDLITTIFNIPFNCARIMLYEWPFPDFLCVLMPTVQVTSVYVSTVTMAAIGVHRYRAVRLIRVKRLSKTSQIELKKIPSLYMSNSKVILWIVAIWILSILLSLPHSLFNQVVDGVVFHGMTTRRCRAVYPEDYEDQMPLILSLEATLTQFLIPLSITGYLYAKIAKIIQRQGQLAKHFCDEMNRRACEVKRKRIMMLILLVVAFVISWLPLTTYHLLNDFHLVPFNYSVFLLLHQLAMSSVCHNPLIYLAMNTDFRNKAKTLFCFRHCFCLRKSGGERGSLTKSNSMLATMPNGSKCSNEISLTNEASRTIVRNSSGPVLDPTPGLGNRNTRAGSEVDIPMKCITVERILVAKTNNTDEDDGNSLNQQSESL